ncbi:MAG: SDR family NAD(P)-dependent oxidoreductase, partial [Vulcanimicrobiaceae bacterium]
MNARIAVVLTGASTGIGAATAIALARRGTIVFAGVRNDVDAARLADQNDNISPITLDVTDTASIAAAAEIVCAAGLQLRGLINNAGIVVAGPLEHVAKADLRRQFDVNVFGQVAVTQAFLPQLREARGRIIFVGSISGRIAMPFMAPYSA